MNRGIPPLAYGQSYYTLRSIFFDGVPPPQIHLHLRLFDVNKEVPIGDLTSKLPLSSISRSQNLAHNAPGTTFPNILSFSSADLFRSQIVSHTVNSRRIWILLPRRQLSLING